MTETSHPVDVTRDRAAPAGPARESWAPLASLRHEIDRLFDDFHGRGWPSASRLMQRLPFGDEWPVAPAMDMVEADGEYRLTVELPGMKPEDVEIRLTDGALVMRGTKSEERREETEDRLLSERRYGAFHRSLSLPPGVDADRIAASVSDGVLTVTLPKSAEAKQKERKIEVKAA